ncbi:hypothetical protein PybrP1_010923 [[Pythium] brassicae (nom. inval.)]|nr:hypothetical protein PybrP1_010923 [[Pythium] brassicae (nom. inval.)]
MSHRSNAEKKLIVKLYNYFKREAARRSEDPACVGIADRARVGAERRVLVRRPSSRGRPPRALGSDAQEDIASVISSRNLQKMSTTSHHVKNAVLEKIGRLVSDRTVCRELKRMKFTYIQGQQRDPRADEKQRQVSASVSHREAPKPHGATAAKAS